MKNENVLCVPTDALKSKFDLRSQSWSVSKDNIDALPFSFIPRADAETNNDFKQLIPYAIFTDAQGLVLTYCRKGSEKRLADMRSAGIGGNVNDADAGSCVSERLVIGLQRKVQEELGLSISSDQFSLAGMIDDEDSEVGHRHTGVVFLVKLDVNAQISPAEDELDDIQWIKPYKIDFSKFEKWSELAVKLTCNGARRKVHIALVGGQTAPVYNGIIATWPDVVFLVCSDGERGSKTEGERIKEIIEHDQQCEIVIADPTDLDNINYAIESIKQKISPDDDVTLNVVGGTKHWTILFNNAFVNVPNASILLIDQNNLACDVTHHKTWKIDFDMDRVFILYGNPLVNYTKFSDYDDKLDATCVKQIEDARRINFNQFNKLVTVMPRQREAEVRQNKEGKFCDTQGCVEWIKPDFARISLYHKGTRRTQEFEFHSPNAVKLLFNCGWFEYKVARALSHWHKAKEIRMNCVFPVQTGAPKNETDIIVNAGEKILFVECKTQISSNTDIDKFRTVVSNYGGDASKALFITQSRVKDLVAREKCKESSILLFSIEEEGPDFETALIEKLDEYMKQINKR